MTPVATPLLRLRPTMQSDLDFVVAVEQDAANRHFIVEAGDGWAQAGFAILQGCRNPHGSIELKRVVLQPKGLGHGRTVVRLLADMAFRDLGAHRFWLDVKARNVRALGLYRSEGFVEEGCLRESVREDDGYESLVVLSLLAAEHARLGAGRSAAAPAAG